MQSCLTYNSDQRYYNIKILLDLNYESVWFACYSFTGYSFDAGGSISQYVLLFIYIFDISVECNKVCISMHVHFLVWIYIWVCWFRALAYRRLGNPVGWFDCHVKRVKVSAIFSASMFALSEGDKTCLQERADSDKQSHI